MKIVRSPEPKLPIKTKLAIGWLVLVGIYFVVGGALATFRQIILPSANTTWLSIIVSAILFFVAALFFSFLPIILLRMRREWAWTLAVILLFVALALALILIVAYAELGPLFILSMSLIPFILVILDQPKYFAMLRQRELNKNKVTIEP
jgi:hypothetical protein